MKNDAQRQREYRERLKTRKLLAKAEPLLGPMLSELKARIEALEAEVATLKERGVSSAASTAIQFGLTRCNCVVRDGEPLHTNACLREQIDAAVLMAKGGRKPQAHGRDLRAGGRRPRRCEAA